SFFCSAPCGAILPSRPARAAVKDGPTWGPPEGLEIELPNLPGAHAGGPAGSHGATARCDVPGGANRRARAREVLRLAQRRAERTLQSVAAAPSVIPAGP